MCFSVWGSAHSRGDGYTDVLPTVVTTALGRKLLSADSD